jgi:hypothetical protein
MKISQKITLISIFSCFATLSFGQTKSDGVITTGEVKVEKERKVTLPSVTKPKDKPKLIENTTNASKQVTFEIADRKTKEITQNMSLTGTDYKQADSSMTVYENFVKMAFGNYGRFYTEGLLSSAATDLGQATLDFKHNKATKGPIKNEVSANSLTDIGLNGKYNNDYFQLKSAIGFEQQNYNFYGFKEDSIAYKPGPDTLKQRINNFKFSLGMENANRESSLDYKINTGIRTLKDRYSASEFEWATEGNFVLPVINNFYALVNAKSFISNRSDSLVNKRNLLKIRPSFILKYPKLSINFGVNVVSEKDVDPLYFKNINRTKAYPVVNIDYYLGNSLFLFGGYEGDIYRNTLRSFLNDNPWLNKKVNLQNTEKKGDIFVGLKGNMGSNFNYDLKTSYERLNNFAVFNNAPTDSTRFNILYETETIGNLKINANLYYKFNDVWRSTIKLENNTFEAKTLKALYHTPKFKSTWSNTLAFKQKLFIGTDVYILGGSQAYNAKTDKLQKIKGIFDVNAKMNYQFSNHLSGIVYLNNLMSRSYQRFQYYPQQALNFMVGLSYGFSTDSILNIK